MEHRTTLSHCPICDNDTLENVMNVTDYMITKEEFTIQRCKKCDFHFTNPRPEESVNGNYYKSEDYISHSSTQKGVVNKLYNLVRSYTLKKKRKLIEKLTNERNLLDIGSGTGHFLNECKTKGWNTLGLEPDTDARLFAKTNFNVELSPIEELYALEHEKYNVVTMWHVLEHVYHLQKDVSQIVSLIKKDGYFVIAVPNHKSWDAQQYQFFWAAYDVPRHLYHFSEDNVKALMQNFGMTHVKTLPMKFDSFYVSMLSEKYKNGSIVKAFFNGLKSNLKAKSGFGYSSQIYIFKK
ncbi:MAG TPA: class I SAM-dependent methyltransferase [Crocinitomicaceae bacterium]|nr:class I SAM-dependent methyltransferase [Crocinitomicaceae bacterium]